jgi:hypothetical protein
LSSKLNASLLGDSCATGSAKKKGSSSGEGITVGGFMLAMVLGVASTAAVLYGVYSFYLRQRMHQEMRDIMQQVGAGHDAAMRYGAWCSSEGRVMVQQCGVGHDAAVRGGA